MREGIVAARCIGVSYGQMRTVQLHAVEYD